MHVAQDLAAKEVCFKEVQVQLRHMQTLGQQLQDAIARANRHAGEAAHKEEEAAYLRGAVNTLQQQLDDLGTTYDNALAQHATTMQVRCQGCNRRRGGGGLVPSACRVWM